MKRISLLSILAISFLSSPAWSLEKNICDKFDGIQLKRECWKDKGKSEHQLDIEKKAAADREASRKEQARKNAEERKIKESQVVKTFFLDELNLIDKFPFLAQGYKRTWTGSFKWDEINSPKQVCNVMGFDDELVGTTAELSANQNFSFLTNFFMQKHGEDKIGIVVKSNDKIDFMTSADEKYYELKSYYRITCVRDKDPNSVSDQKFTLENYEYELDKASMSYQEYKSNKEDDAKSQNQNNNDGDDFSHIINSK